MPLAPTTIAALGPELQDYAVDIARAAELAVEVERIAARVRAAAASSLDFFDEPAHFTRALESLAER